MLSFIVQRSFVTINSQCRAFMAVKKLKVSVNHHFVTKIHFIFCVRPLFTFTQMYSGPVRLRHLTIANLWMVWNVWSTFMALFAGWAPGQALLCLLCGGGGGGLGGATREIWLENSHRRPHTTSETLLLTIIVFFLIIIRDETDIFCYIGVLSHAVVLYQLATRSEHLDWMCRVKFLWCVNW